MGEERRRNPGPRGAQANERGKAWMAPSLLVRSRASPEPETKSAYDDAAPGEAHPICLPPPEAQPQGAEGEKPALTLCAMNKIAQ